MATMAPGGASAPKTVQVPRTSTIVRIAASSAPPGGRGSSLSEVSTSGATSNAPSASLLHQEATVVGSGAPSQAFAAAAATRAPGTAPAAAPNASSATSRTLRRPNGAPLMWQSSDALVRGNRALASAHETARAAGCPCRNTWASSATKMTASQTGQRSRFVRRSSASVKPLGSQKSAFVPGVKTKR